MLTINKEQSQAGVLGERSTRLGYNGNVDHPKHYNNINGVECIDVVEQMNFNKGNAIKYLWRAGDKGVGVDKEIEDLQKAVWYINREIDRIKKMAS
jgi:hypothetical protein